MRRGSLNILNSECSILKGVPVVSFLKKLFDWAEVWIVHLK